MVHMAKAHRTERRTDALSKDRIVDAAIEILDTDAMGSDAAGAMRPPAHAPCGAAPVTAQRPRAVRASMPISRATMNAASPAHTPPMPQ